MPADLFIYREDDAQLLTPEQILEHLTESGFSCELSLNEEEAWISFAGQECALMFAVKEGEAAWASFQVPYTGDLEFPDRVLEALQPVGWVYAEGSF